MSDYSKIEWTDATWNPLRGCDKVSPGCGYCYAEVFAERFRGVRGHPYEHGFDLRLAPEKLVDPFQWGGPRRVFVNSMSDLFHPSVPDEYILAVAEVMRTANWHTFQVLTKRAERMSKLLNGKLQSAASDNHIWWGVSVEDRRYGIPRIAYLRATPASVRFLSIEPLLEELGDLDLTGIHWVIVGGESGRRARPMEKSWVERLLAQCRRSEVPFFFKQWGGREKGRNGRELNGRTYDEAPPALGWPVPPRERRIALAAQFRPVVERFSRMSQAPAS